MHVIDCLLKPAPRIRLSVLNLASVLLLALITACASKPSNQVAFEAFMRDSSIATAQFKHRIQYIEQTKLESPQENKRHKRSLRIFIEGDGTPWFREKYVVNDPSPTKLLMYEAMQAITGSKLYLGRPCYFQTADSNCHYRYWTSHRYAPEVVKSMLVVLNPYLQDYTELVFIGHSGGGALATFLACQVQTAPSKSISLITLSANLDTDKWTAQHGWTRLSGSMNPAADLAPCKHLKQYHYVGMDDKNVPFSLNTQFFEQQGTAPIVYELADHSNWLHFWPEIVQSNPALREN